MLYNMPIIMSQPGVGIPNGGQPTFNIQGMASSTTYPRYVAPSTTNTQQATESSAQEMALVAYTWNRLQANVITGPTGGATLTITSRINGANGTQSVTLASGQSGIFTDTSHSDAVAATDMIDWAITSPGAGSTTIGYIKCLV